MEDSVGSSKPTLSSSTWKLAKSFTYGVLTGVALPFVVRLYHKWRLPNPRKIQSTLLPMLRANTEVRASIGSSLRPGLLSAYTYRGGIKWRVPAWSNKWSSLSPVTYQSWHLQLLFQIIGDRGVGMVSVQTESSNSKKGRDQLKSLLLDFSNGERLVLKGEMLTAAGTLVEYKEITD